MKFKILLFFISAIALASCVDIPDFDDTPKIDFNSIDSETRSDTNGKNKQEYVTISINFEDGDGDLGATDDERNDSINFLPPYGDWGNYELVTSRWDGSKWIDQILDIDKVKFFPLLKKDGKKGPINGKLDLHTTAYYTPNTKQVLFKFKIRIRDRALHVSNQITTDSLYLPFYE